MSSLSEARAGALAVAPMLIGVVPFGLVAGAAPVSQGLGVAYLLTDQAYALSIARWAPGGDPAGRFPYYLGAATVLWAAWQVATVVGVLVGGAVPDDVPLEFAVPLVFLVLLVPLLTSRPAVAAAAVGGAVAVAAAELGAGPVSIVTGAASGIAAGALVDVLAEGRRPPGPVSP